MTSILTTKLFIPPSRPDAVVRQRLIDQLNEGKTHQLTLISASAGFGKTSLLSAWAANCDQPVAWLSLDEEHNDPHRFLLYVVAALQTVDTKIGEAVLNALQLPQTPPLQSMLTTLINEITAVSPNFALILDDYHLIESQAVDQALIFLVQHVPPSMQLVIATREDPPLPLARLRARGQLTELRAHDLRFTQAETAEFFNQSMRLALSAEDVDALEKRTEGWVTGLQLAALSLRQHQNKADFVQSFSGTHQFVLDYLIEEILQQQPENIQHFLLSTSILEHLSGSLCDALFPEADSSSQEILEYLEQANLLLVPLDDKREWYRYHHLFAEALQARLSKSYPTEALALHLRASVWYEQNKYWANAIHHAFAAQDFERAANLVEQEWEANSGNQYQNTIWIGWVQALPDDLVRSRITLSLGLAWALLFAGEIEAAGDRLDDASRLLALASNSDEHEAEIRSDLALLAVARAFYSRALGNNGDTINHAQQALSLSSGSNDYIVGLASSLLGLVYWAEGELETAVKYVSDAITTLKMTGDILFAMSGTFVLAQIKITQGRLFEAVHIYEEAIRLATARGEPILPGTAELHLMLGKLYHEQSKADDAQAHFQQAEMLGKQGALPEWPYDLYLVQAQLKQEQGELEDAFHLLAEAERIFQRGPVPDIRPVGALKTRVLIQQGKLTEALAWVRKNELSVEGELHYLQEFEYLTFARALIATGDTTEAVSLLERLFKEAEAGERVGSLIEILILQSLVYDMQNDTASALASLEQALTLAEPESYVRIFVNEGAPMTHLLTKAAEQGMMPNFVAKLLTIIEAESQNRIKESASPLFSQQPLVDPLSPRELEVLQLIAQGFSNREICEQLFLAMDTVKGHNRRIFGKLGVKNRTKAVARARELALI